MYLYVKTFELYQFANKNMKKELWQAGKNVKFFVSWVLMDIFIVKLHPFINVFGCPFPLPTPPPIVFG